MEGDLVANDVIYFAQSKFPTTSQVIHLPPAINYAWTGDTDIGQGFNCLQIITIK